MKSILEAFADDELEPNPPHTAPNSAHAKALDRLMKHEKLVFDALGEQQHQLMEDFEDAQGNMDDIARTDRFVTGFKLGVLMMTEVYEGRDELFARLGNHN